MFQHPVANTFFTTKLFLSMFCIIFLSAVFMPLHAQEYYGDDEQLHQQIYQDKQELNAEIKQLVEEIGNGLPSMIEGEYVYSTNILPEFYKNRAYMPAWDKWETLMDIATALENSFLDGLIPEDYHKDALLGIMQKIQYGLEQDELNYALVAEFDILLSDAVLLYAYHLLNGKVDPKSLDNKWNFSPRDLSPISPENLEKHIESGSVSEALDQMRPQMQSYKMCMELLASYRSIAENGGLETIDDSIIREGAIEDLNFSIEQKIEMLRVNLERFRWIPANFTDNYVLVNIAAYEVYYFKDHELVFSAIAQIGKLGSKTPVFKERLEYIEFCPVWTLPQSIIRKEIIPGINKYPNYLDSLHYEVFDQLWNRIPNSSVDYNDLSASPSHYIVRQRPGPWNELGEVKFIFPNKYAIYLHDTPEKDLFNEQDRAFSHGCIRTKDPLLLAEKLLEGTAWTKEKIDETMQARKTKRVYPADDIDVLLLYWTAGYSEDAGFNFYKDIYGRDPALLEQLNKSDTQSQSDPGF